MSVALLLAIEYRTCLYCGKEWRTGTMDLNRYCSTGCWADALAEDLAGPGPARGPFDEKSSGTTGSGRSAAATRLARLAALRARAKRVNR